ncbi:MAG: T9SS type A sorting domain-containing protein [Bacteroidetes bacterium]|nr:T9SS type A sorting domain-containing protein [Bacteroidota bacterium]
MYKKYISFFFILFTLRVWSQPAFIGTDINGGYYTTYTLNQYLVFSQKTIQASGSYSSGVIKWEFMKSNSGSPDFSINWRPYIGSNTIMGFDSVINPSSQVASARYNSGYGGTGGFLPATTNGRYYTFNITRNTSSDNYMSVLETNYNPSNISGMTASFTASSGQNGATDIYVSNIPGLNPSEHIYLRYSIDHFASSSLIELNPTSGFDTITIPSLTSGQACEFYFLSSSVSKSSLESQMTIYGQLAADMLSLNIATKTSSSNWSYTQLGKIIVKSSSGARLLCGYSSLKSAFDSINAGLHNGDIYITIDSNSYETATTIIYGSGIGSANYNSIYISSGGNVTRTVYGSISSGSLIKLNGAKNIYINGLNSNGDSLVIVNTYAGAGVSTIEFANGASNDTLKNLTILGSGTSVSSGNIVFTSGGNGNNKDAFIGCSFAPYQSYSPYQTFLVSHSGNSSDSGYIYQCRFSDFGTDANGGYAVHLDSNCSAWKISESSFYQTASRSLLSSSIYLVSININTNGSGHQVSGNYFGGTQPFCLGSVLTINNGLYRAIYMATGSSLNNQIQGNTIKNIAYTTASSDFNQSLIWAYKGNTYIGDQTSNVLGSLSSNNNIVIENNVTTGTPAFSAILIGDDTTTNYSFNISNNLIGGITVSRNSGTQATTVKGIYLKGGASSVYVVSGNIVGSYTQSQSLNNTSSTGINSSNGSVIGISSEVASFHATVSIYNNIIQNLSNNGASPGQQTIGVYLYSSGMSASTQLYRNTIRSLTHSAANIGTGYLSSVLGVLAIHPQANSSSYIYDNLIYNLANSSNFGNTSVTGLYLSGDRNFQSKVYKNLIYGLKLSTSSNNGSVNGIYTGDGQNLYYNNIIRLGTDSSNNSITNGYQINGIYDENDTNYFYFNTVFVAGNYVTSASNTYAFNSLPSTTLRVFKNNILINTRSNNSGSAKNYAFKLGGSGVGPSGLVSDYNNIYTNGIGGVLAYYNGADITAISGLRSATGNDLNSIEHDPSFVSSTYLEPTSVYIHNAAESVSGISTDIYGIARNTPPDIGAVEFNIDIRNQFNDTSIASGCPTISGSEWIHITDNNGALVFSINPNGNDLGATCWGIREYAASGIRTDSTKILNNGVNKFGYYLDRNFYITPTNQPTTDVSIKFYFKANEINELKDSVINKYGVTIGGGDIDITRYHNVSSDLNPYNNQGSQSDFTLLNSSSTLYNNDFYLQVLTNSFSEFIPSYVPDHTASPLSIGDVDLVIDNKPEIAELNWKTSVLENMVSFKIERKEYNQTMWNEIGGVDSWALVGRDNRFSFYDSVSQPYFSFVYRIKQLLADGSFIYSNVVYKNAKSLPSNEYRVYPNPMVDNLYIQQEVPQQLRIICRDINGLIKGEWNAESQAETQINFVELPTGIYILEIANGFQTKRFKVMKL